MHRGKPLLIGLTGGLGTGKSEALRAFGRSGAATVSLDALAHELSRPGRPVHRAVVRSFGRGVLGPDGRLDRRAIAAEVFAKPALRRRLERAAHPPILREMRRRLAGVRRPVAVVDVPLLFEAGLQKDFDLTVVVTARKALQLRRVRRRSGMGRSEALRRIRAQLPMKMKERLADVVIHNEGGLKGLRRSVAEYQRAFGLIAASLTRRKRSK